MPKRSRPLVRPLRPFSLDSPVKPPILPYHASRRYTCIDITVRPSSYSFFRAPLTANFVRESPIIHAHATPPWIRHSAINPDLSFHDKLTRLPLYLCGGDDNHIFTFPYTRFYGNSYEGRNWSSVRCAPLSRFTPKLIRRISHPIDKVDCTASVVSANLLRYRGSTLREFELQSPQGAITYC